ncbi:LOW QUALITY PROTEIN: vacuolar fusion protein MON1 homolog A-like [Oppia nitens]|uniref:LOW QUALITY PROTEIN: vacuolar fusion protein MON1 homolog A-like n=1 Tax=Oppia nitens TaxID=1686743 RepID=UPI0023DC8273|nr:LOW QUALITY PROTEIN: vacuolar fusion protein MON1 homolog A-like [Oppia nitens]
MTSNESPEAVANGLDSLRLQPRTNGAKDLDVFVMSESGKPVYCYSRREDSITLMGVCVALIHVTDKLENDTIRHIQTIGGLRIAFALKSPLIICFVFRVNLGIDANILINQVNAQIISILTAKTLKSVFEQRPTFDLKRLLSGSEKLIDTLIDVILSPINANKSENNCNNQMNAFLSSSMTTSKTIGNQSIINNRSTISTRVYIPIRVMAAQLRESVYNIINSCASSAPNVIFSLLFSVDKKAKEEYNGSNNYIQLICVCNQFKARLNPLDIQLLYSLVMASESQLASVESFFLPICLPRFDSNNFLHTHISYLSNEYCLALLTTDREEFHKCQLTKESIIDRLAKVHLTPSRSNLSDLSQPQLQYLWYQSHRQSVLWRQSPVFEFSSLNHYITNRMLKSNLKTFWLRSESDGLLLGWHSPTFQLYAQFDVTITQLQALTAIQAIIKWIKKEEDKFVIKDYQ